MPRKPSIDHGKPVLMTFLMTRWRTRKLTIRFESFEDGIAWYRKKPRRRWLLTGGNWPSLRSQRGAGLMLLSTEQA